MKIKVMLIASVLFSACNESDNAKKDYINLEFNGQVTKKFLDKEAKMQPSITLTNGISYRIENLDIFNSIKIGDTLFKRSSSMKYYLIKEGDTVVFYQKWGNTLLTD